MQSMYATKSSDDVLAALQTTIHGLIESDVTARRAEHGFNELPEKKKSVLLLFLSQFNDTMVFVLFGALSISIAMPFFENGGHPEAEQFVDAIVIGAILLLNAILGFIQEYKAEEAIAMLKKLTAPSMRVRRAGQELVVPSREVVPGDIGIVEAGDKIAADGRIISHSHLRVNESSLTGESTAVDKVSEAMGSGKLPLAEQRNMLFSGTLVTRGFAEYVIVATAIRTEIGKIAKLVSETEFPQTPLQMRMGGLG